MGLEPIVENGIIFYKIEFLLKTKLKNVPLKMNKFFIKTLFHQQSFKRSLII